MRRCTSYRKWTNVEEYMQVYLDLLKDIIDNGTDKDDRTGTGTRSVFGRQIRFDLSEGFPCLTTKKMHLGAIIRELLWFLNGVPDRRILHSGKFDESRFDIWKGNALDRKDNIRFNGYNIGNLYPVMWRYFPVAIPTASCYVNRRPGTDTPDDIQHPVIEFRKYYRSGEVVNTESCGSYTILGKGTGDNIVLQFNKTGYVTEVSKATEHVKDHLMPSVEGIGYHGYGSFDKKSPTYKHLYRMWQDMLIRCYRPRENHRGYSHISVSREWHNFSNFYNDAYNLPNFQEFVDSNYTYNLDKDYFGSAIYCKESCIFISPELNKSLNAGGTCNFRVYKFEDKEFFSQTSLENYLYGKRRKLDDTELISLGVEIICDDGDRLIRPKIFIDQIANIIEEIKNNSDSRRLVINSWNVESDRNAVLSACHNTFQFYVANGKLSCQLYQRSGDAFLGVPFNIASYALLTMMVAQACDLEPGEFVHTFGDLHLYNDHFEQAHTQMSREPRPLPKMKINPEVKDLFDFKFEDFELVEYDPHPHIKAKVSV